MESNSPNVVLSLFLLLQLGGVLAFVLSTLYVLYCFNRAASGVERMADAAEAWLALQHYQATRNAQSGSPGNPDEPTVATSNVAAPTSPIVAVETVRPTPPPPPQTPPTAPQTPASAPPTAPSSEASQNF